MGNNTRHKKFSEIGNSISGQTFKSTDFTGSCWLPQSHAAYLGPYMELEANFKQPYLKNVSLIFN